MIAEELDVPYKSNILKFKQSQKKPYINVDPNMRYAHGTSSPCLEYVSHCVYRLQPSVRGHLGDTGCKQGVEPVHNCGGRMKPWLFGISSEKSKPNDFL